jgi:hypothetical protein
MLQPNYKDVRMIIFIKVASLRVIVHISNLITEITSEATLICTITPRDMLFFIIPNQHFLLYQTNIIM